MEQREGEAEKWNANGTNRPIYVVPRVNKKWNTLRTQFHRVGKNGKKKEKQSTGPIFLLELKVGMKASSGLGQNKRHSNKMLDYRTFLENVSKSNRT